MVSDRRGLAAGLTAAGFGGGSALTPIPISLTIHAIGWGHAMAIWGAIQGLVIFALALVVSFRRKTGHRQGGTQRR